MRKLSVLFLALIIFYNSFGQKEMIVNMPFNGNTIYSFSEHIDSLSHLPSIIQFNLDSHIKRILGTMSENVSFSHGQIVDLNNVFKADSITFSRDWIIPKYDLNFLLCDSSIGIRSYYIQIRLDKYGQILYTNWPKESHSNKNLFENRTEIERYALKQAKTKGFNLNNYIVDFKYSIDFDKLCWVFKFPAKIEEYRQEYDTIEIPWIQLKVIDEYKSVRSTLF